MQSIKQAQNTLGSNFDVGGIERGGGLDLTAVEKVMFEGAKKFLQLAQQRIRQRNKVDKGNLADIEVFPLEEKGGLYSITIGYPMSNPASKYWDFQNLGVKGIQSRSPNSKYSFKNLTVSANMVKAIMAWYLRHKNYIRNEDQRTGLTGLQVKRKNLNRVTDPQKKLRDLAKRTAENIKKRGIARVGFFEDNKEKAFGEDFQKKLSIALGQSVALTIKKTYNGYYNR
jgi:hypothetical protein